MPNQTQLIDMFVVERGKAEWIQVYEDGRAGCYISVPINPLKNKELFFNKFSHEILVGEMFYFQDIKKSFVVVKSALWIDPLKEKKMTEEHKGLPVAGYLPQSNEKVQLVNVNKELEERCLRRIEWFEEENKAAYNTFLASLREENDTNKVLPTYKPLYDPRMLALAKTGIQDAMMWLNRSVFQPSRVVLPEDKIPSERTAEAINEAEDIKEPRFNNSNELIASLDAESNKQGE